MNINIKTICDIAIQAGNEIMEVYEKDFDVNYKDDNSPLTEADLAANNIIVNNLSRHYPEIPILSEESKQVSYQDRKNWDRLWLVDPLDGTKEFVKKNGEFTVNIALIENGEPVLGVVYAPFLKKLYYGDNNGSYMVDNETSAQALPLNQIPENTIRIVASKSHISPETEDFIANIQKENPDKSLETLSMGSSLKICLIAEGKADIYPRLGPTMEWDTGAAHAVALHAGKRIFVYENGNTTQKSLIYNKENLLNPWFVVK